MATFPVSEFLEQQQALLALGLLVACYLILSLGEILLPRRRPGPTAGWRWLNNLSLTLTSMLLLRQVKLLMPIAAAWWAAQAGFGLLYVIDAGWLLSLVATFLLLDLATYFYHRISHSVPLLWRLHMVHHSDTDFDLTTTYRNHPINLIIALGARLPAVILLGAPVYAIVVYELASIVAELFSHSNIRISERWDRRLRRFVVTPDYHRTHHSSTREYTDSNFASVLPLFDWLFGTGSTRAYVEHEECEIGLEYFREPVDSRLDHLILMPFRNFRSASTVPVQPLRSDYGS